MEDIKSSIKDSDSSKQVTKEELEAMKEQLEILMREQDGAKRIYQGRIQMGGLIHDSESVRILAQMILERQRQIDELEGQIAKAEELFQENKAQSEEVQQTALIEYSHNPILRWFQRHLNKIEKLITKLEQSSSKKYRAKPKILEEFDEMEAYRTIANMDFSENKTTENGSWNLSPKAVDEIREGQVKIAEAHRNVNNLGQVQDTSKGRTK